ADREPRVLRDPAKAPLVGADHQDVAALPTRPSALLTGNLGSCATPPRRRLSAPTIRTWRLCRLVRLRCWPGTSGLARPRQGAACRRRPSGRGGFADSSVCAAERGPRVLRSRAKAPL